MTTATARIPAGLSVSAGRVLARFGVLGVFVLIVLAFAVLETDNFLAGENLKSILTQSAALAVVAFGLTVVLVMNEFDLSFGAMAGLSGAVAFTLIGVEGVDWRLAIVLCVLVGVVAGAANGILSAYLGAPSFVITLAVGTILTGIEFTITNQQTLFEGVPDAYIQIGQGNFLGLNIQVIVAIVLFVATYLYLEHTEQGRYMHAIGGNPEAAYLTGIAVRRLRLTGFMIMGAAGAIAGILLSAQSANSSPNFGAPLLLPAFAAVFLGSTAFRPGQFNVLGTLLGILFLAVLQNGLTLMDATTAVISIVQGGVLVAAVLVTVAGRRAA
ncbi:MAG TPA: ABC transporter permease [Thermoleophilaceae bacterium]|nr:ABC transporter permease [Thermoleophilaceae bacterium]